MAKKARFDFVEMKKAGKKVTWITAYDFSIARFAGKAGIDMILVGDVTRHGGVRLRQHHPGYHGRVYHLLQGDEKGSAGNPRDR